jgi:hypothetical protein
MNEIKKYITQYPSCLWNSKEDLQLGPIYLRHLGQPNIPTLHTIFELEKPAILSFVEINNIFKELKNVNESDYGVKGRFILAVSQFETMLSDLIKKHLQFFPQKLTTYKKSKYFNYSENKELVITQEIINKGSIIENIIDNEVYKLGYKDIVSQIEALENVMSITLNRASINFDELIEVKETRNLLLHSNLRVSELYLNKTKSVKRSYDHGEKIIIDKAYALKSLSLLLMISEEIIFQLRDKYSKFNLLHLLSRLWRFTFNNPVIRLEDFAVINVEEDIYDGPFKIPGFLSSSELTYMEFWQAQRTSTPLNRPSMVHLSSGNKLSFLVEVFGELRLTHW